MLNLSDRDDDNWQYDYCREWNQPDSDVYSRVESKDIKTYDQLYCEKCGERVFEINDAISCGEDSDYVIVYHCSDTKDILEKWDLGPWCDHMSYIALTKEERDLKFGYKDL
jgi:hypothetical protein